MAKNYTRDLLFSIIVNIVLAVYGIIIMVTQHLDQSATTYNPDLVIWVIVSVALLVVDAGVVSALMIGRGNFPLIALIINSALAGFGIAIMIVFVPSDVLILIWVPIADVVNGLTMYFNAEEKP